MTVNATIPQASRNRYNTGIPLPLERFYFWEKNHPDKVCFTQPMGGGETRDMTWSEVAAQVRSMAQYLLDQGVKPGDRIAILSKNCAYWIMSDLAIWMAGGISVPLYPTLTADSVQQILDHSETTMLFVGKLDDWDTMKGGVDSRIRCISYPLSPANDFPTWDDIVAETPPLQDNPSRSHGELATIIYTSGTTGMPKGVMHTFHGIASGASQASNVYEVSSSDRAISYLPLSHVAERMCIEMIQLYEGIHVHFAESLDTFAADLRRAKPTIFPACGPSSRLVFSASFLNAN